jgi:hypothetical protein
MYKPFTRYLNKKLNGINIKTDRDLKLVTLPSLLSLKYLKPSSEKKVNVKKTNEQLMKEKIFRAIQSLNFPKCFDVLAFNIEAKSFIPMLTAVTSVPQE